MPSLRNLHKLLIPEIRAKNLRALRFAMRGLYWDLIDGCDPGILTATIVDRDHNFCVLA